jgi:hypothetical protein
MMSEHNDPSRIVDDARDRLEEAERSEAAERLRALEELHEVLDRELDPEQAPPPGR